MVKCYTQLKLSALLSFNSSYASTVRVLVHGFGEIGRASGRERVLMPV